MHLIVKIMLIQQQFLRAQEFIHGHARPLDRALFEFSFRKGSAEEVISELGQYRNDDGGFGHGIEPDIQSAPSHNYGTTLAFQYLDAVQTPKDHEFYQGGIQYFVDHVKPATCGWELVGPMAMEGPHAPWWDFDITATTAHHELQTDPEKALATAGEGWGNGSAEILGYLYRHADQVPPDILTAATAVVHVDLQSRTDSMGMHEFMCYHLLAKDAPSELRTLVIQTLKQLAPTVLPVKEKWEGYELRPCWVVSSPDDPLAETLHDTLIKNLDFEITQQGDDGAWAPFWTWGRDEENWEKAEVEWKGRLTVQFLRTLKHYNYIESSALR